MIIDFDTNKLKCVDVLHVGISDRYNTRCSLNDNTFRLIMLHFSENGKKNKTVYIHSDSLIENTKVINWIRMLPEVFKDIHTVIVTDLINVSDTFVEACRKLLTFTDLTIDIAITNPLRFKLTMDNLNKVYDLLPPLNLKLTIKYTNDMITYISDHYNEFDDTLEFISECYSINNYAELLDENIIRNFFELYFCNPNSSNMLLSSLYNGLTHGWVNDMSTESLYELYIDSNEEVYLWNLHSLKIPLNKTWNDIMDINVDSYFINYKSLYSDIECSQCHICNKCSVYQINNVGSDKSNTLCINVDKMLCLNTMLAYNTWLGCYSNTLRTVLSASTNDTLQNLQLISKGLSLLSYINK